MGWEGCGHGLSSGTAAAAAAAPHGCGNAWGSPGGSAPVGGGTDILGAPPPSEDLQPQPPPTPPIPKYIWTPAKTPQPPPHPLGPPQIHQQSPLQRQPSLPPSYNTPRSPQGAQPPPIPQCSKTPLVPPSASTSHNVPPPDHPKTSPPQPTVPPPHLQHLGGHMRWWCPLRGGPHGDGRRWAGGLGGCRGAGGAASTSFSALLLLCLCPHQLLPQQHPR